MRRFLPLFAFTTLLLGMLHTVPAAAQDRVRCFPETGRCISGPILTYWERNGGLPVFGYPTTDLVNEGVYEQDSGYSWTGPLQWFERDRLEDHSAEGQGVLAGRLGAQALYYQARPWQTQPQVSGAAPRCRFFAETSHSLCEPFLGYWQRNGGLERFGYPVTEPQQETVEAWSGTVQYFERRRMEHHTELPGAPVLLGLLGNELRGLTSSAPCTTNVIPELRNVWKYDQVSFAFQRQMGCPTDAMRDVGVARQPFERGIMLYAVVEAGQGVIWSLKTDPQPLRYTRHLDTWAPPQPFSGGETPPAGRIEPVRGFGKVWREQPGVRTALGWALDNEIGDRGTLQRFQNGEVLWTYADDFVWIFGPNGQVTAFTRR